MDRVNNTTNTADSSEESRETRTDTKAMAERRKGARPAAASRQSAVVRGEHAPTPLNLPSPHKHPPPLSDSSCIANHSAVHPLQRSLADVAARASLPCCEICWLQVTFPDCGPRRPPRSSSQRRCSPSTRVSRTSRTSMPCRELVREKKHKGKRMSSPGKQCRATGVTCH